MADACESGNENASAVANTGVFVEDRAGKGRKRRSLRKALGVKLEIGNLKNHGEVSCLVFALKCTLRGWESFKGLDHPGQTKN
jgi:hypothetical protein